MKRFVLFAAAGLLAVSLTVSSSSAQDTSSDENLVKASRVSWKKATVNKDLSGKIKIDGSSTVYPISEAAAASFKKLFPGVSTTVGQSGTGGGFKRFTKGETDISDASRPIKDKEFKMCKDNKIGFVEIPIAYDGLTIVVNKKNKFLDTLTIDQLKKIFLADSAAKKWSDIDPKYPAEDIKIYAPGTDSGTFDYFKEVMVGKSKASIRGDMSTSEDDSILVNGVAGDEIAIGFFGAAYYFQNTDKLKSIKVVNPKTGKAVGPTAETIENGSYAPFSRPLFIYLNRKSINKPQVEKFVDYYIANAAMFAKEVGYVPLPDAVYEEAMVNFMDENTGTHYLTKEMEKRSGPVTEVYSSKNRMK